MSDTKSRCFPEYAEMSNQQQISHFAECPEERNTGFALLKVRGKTQTQIRTAQSARILELQIDKLEFLAEFTKRARCEITRRTTRTDEVRMDARGRSTFPDGIIKRTALEPVLRKPREHLTALLDLCTDDKKHQM